MTSLKSQSPLKHPQTHSPSFPLLPSLASPGYCISGKEIEVCGSGSPRFFPIIRAWLAGLLWFPAPPAVSPGSPVLSPNPCGTFSWPTSKSPFTPFLPCKVSPVSEAMWQEGAAKATQSQPCLAAEPGFKSQRRSPCAAPFPTPPTICYSCWRPHISPTLLGCRSKSRQAWPRGVAPTISKLPGWLCNQGELPPSYIMG